jgi:hypothetical protein
VHFFTCEYFACLSMQGEAPVELSIK